ncbi:MAG: 50S ribosomal protein L30 [Steroidobacteraceae bacterium]|jgi:large subunit ribosomal protein L30|nr:50S ribosomal protein L30 [Steroidobacteraceae bacterium]
MVKKDASVKTVKVTLVKSVHGQLHRHRATASGLGLRRINQTAVVADTRENRGMINASRHLFRVEEA